ncbi:MAG: hypothetical protein Q6373_019390 [Candidatus Sigynarchaeota archaeon]
MLITDRLVADVNTRRYPPPQERVKGAHFPGTDELIKGIEYALGTIQFP